MSEFKCPECSAPPHKCGKGGASRCLNRGNCEGLLCECDDSDDIESDTNADDHGQSESNPCESANCYHCGWGGRLPPSADTKRWPPWAKTALKEKWRPPSGWQPKGKR